MTDLFKKDPCTIVASDGTLRSSAKAQFAGPNLIVLPGSDVVVMPGDEIRRKLPNGSDEAFEVIDPVFYHDGPFGPHFQVSVRRKGLFPANTGGNYTVHVSGTNSRVNIGSHDQSINVAADNLFGDLTSALKAAVADQAKLDEILSVVEDMRRERGSSGFVKSYQKFVGLCADHIGVVSPFLPALTALIGG